MSVRQGTDEPPLEQHHASWRSQRGLDWFAFFLADIQTGWGPFVAVYLATNGWTHLDIGLILTVGTLSGMVLQIPAGALVDLIPAKRLLAAIAVAAISSSALLLAIMAQLQCGATGKGAARDCELPRRTGTGFNQSRARWPHPAQ